MYLKSIKVAGFKSFADLQVIHFNQPFTCIVGPNGCGKSNIIDAVKWVIGESSAKNLRGSQLTDVIFNGSTSRKPQGMAKVELVFDNSQGRLAGQWSAFKEISLSRVLYRDGQSNYYLNQTRCRRKDIIDLFLGTGLGPRSYAIIEQGMVNRFIDAKPLDMRLQIEEASGVSKYKEKRKETYGKLQEAQENLERLDDRCKEIEKRVQSLKVQSEQAQVYQQLKENWAQSRMSLYAVLFNSAASDFENANHQLKTLKQESSELTAQYQEFQAKNARSFVELERQEQVVSDLEHGLQNLQLELKDTQMKWQKHQDRVEYLQKDIEQEQHIHKELDKTISQISQQQKHLDEDGDNQAQRDELASAYQQLTEKRDEHKLLYEKSQKEYQNLLQLKQAPQSRAEVLKSQIQSLESQILSKNTATEQFQREKSLMLENQEQLSARISSMSFESLKEKGSALQLELDSHESQLSQSQQEGLDVDKEKLFVEQNIKQLKTLISQNQNLIDKYDSKPQSSLSENFGVGQSLFKEFQPKTDYADQLAQLLGQNELIHLERQPEFSKLNWSSKRPVHLCWGQAQEQNLLAKKGVMPSYFESYVFLKQWDEVSEVHHKLKSHQVIVLPNGALLGSNWFQPSYEGTAKSRAQCQLELKSQQQQVEQHTHTLNALKSKKEEILTKISQLKQGQLRLKTELKDCQKELQQGQIEFEKAQLELKHIKSTFDEKQRQYRKSIEEIEDAKTAITQYRCELEEVVALIESQESSLGQCEAKVIQLQTELKSIEQELELAHRAYSDEMTRFEKIEREKEHLQKDKQRALDEKERYFQRHKTLNVEVESLKPKLDDLDKEILDVNKKIEQLNHQKVKSYEELDKMKKLNIDITRRRKGFEKEIAIKKEKIHKGEILWEKCLVSQNHIKEQIFDIGLELDQLKDIKSEQSKEVLKNKVQKLEQEIEKLGPINLNACGEYQQESARLEEIVTQCEDIDKSCQILKKAVDDLDKDIVITYQSTFSALQKSFSTLFPKLFGGGQASLKEVELEGHTDKGVIVFAQPPGKKNSTLSSLSGGEKALTAAALVFSFFHLNPAPFCLMDEIDAPLDDNNTERLANMLNYLSETVQCLCVTHSKITMERGHALYGVTMREPGVSRLVSVDLKKAEKIIS